MRYFYRTIFLLGAVALVMTMFSCSPEYIPNMVNSPMFNEKGEVQGNLAAGVSGTDLQLAYAVSDHIAIMANGSFYDETSDTTDDFHRHTLYEVGAGYYDLIGGHGRYEIFGGVGTGKIKGYWEDSPLDNPVSDARFFKFFVQPAIGLRSDYADGSIGSRWVLVRTDYNEEEPEAQAGFHPFFEPFIMGRLGFRNIKLVSQLGFSIPVGQEVPFDYQPFMFNVGLHVNISTLGGS